MPLEFEFDSSFGNDVSPEVLECFCYDDCSDCSRAPTPLYDGSRGWDGPDGHGPEGTPIMERFPARVSRKPKKRSKGTARQPKTRKSR